MLSACAAPAASASTSMQALGYVFNTTTQDVTIFNLAARQVVETKPLGVSVTWLSKEQRFWDGQHIWTFDYPQNQVQAVAIDPRTVTLAGTIPTGGKGPAPSQFRHWLETYTSRRESSVPGLGRASSFHRSPRAFHAGGGQRSFDRSVNDKVLSFSLR